MPQTEDTEIDPRLAEISKRYWNGIEKGELMTLLLEGLLLPYKSKRLSDEDISLITKSAVKGMSDPPCLTIERIDQIMQWVGAEHMQYCKREIVVGPDSRTLMCTCGLNELREWLKNAKKELEDGKE